MHAGRQSSHALGGGEGDDEGGGGDGLCAVHKCLMPCSRAISRARAFHFRMTLQSFPHASTATSWLRAQKARRSLTRRSCLTLAGLGEGGEGVGEGDAGLGEGLLGDGEAAAGLTVGEGEGLCMQGRPPHARFVHMRCRIAGIQAGTAAVCASSAAACNAGQLNRLQPLHTVQRSDQHSPLSHTGRCAQRHTAGEGLFGLGLGLGGLGLGEGLPACRSGDSAQCNVRARG